MSDVITHKGYWNASGNRQMRGCYGTHNYSTYLVLWKARTRKCIAFVAEATDIDKFLAKAFIIFLAKFIVGFSLLEHLPPSGEGLFGFRVFIALFRSLCLRELRAAGMLQWFIGSLLCYERVFLLVLLRFSPLLKNQYDLTCIDLI